MAYQKAIAQSVLLSADPDDIPDGHKAAAEDHLPGDLKEDIERFSINGFADQFFNSHKKWTLFRGRYFKYKTIIIDRTFVLLMSNLIASGAGKS